MKLITTEFGQALQLLVMDEIRPATPLFAPDFYAAIAERYSFVSNPINNIIEAMKSGAKFNVGKAAINGQSVSIAELGIYNDGIIVNAHHTDAADLVMDDFIEWATQRFGFRRAQTHIPRRYASNVVVEFDAAIDSAVVGFNKIRKLAVDAVRAHGQEIELHVTRLTFAPDPTATIGLGATFFIEPRAGRPFSERRYFSGAPLATNGHLAWLEAFEKAVR
jgi:hypothetical protein